MKKLITVVLILALAAMYGCQSSNSPRGGGMTKDVGFKIAVPAYGTDITQGQSKNIPITVVRGVYFKQDVELEIEVPQGISVSPTYVVVKAGDRPEVQLQFTAASNAAIGSYNIYVKGTPESGESTSTIFTMRVVSP